MGRAGACGGADNSFADGYAEFALHVMAVLHVDTMAKNFLIFVVEHQAENLVIDDALDLFGGATKQFFDVQDGAGLASNFIEQ